MSYRTVDELKAEGYKPSTRMTTWDEEVEVNQLMVKRATDETLEEMIVFRGPKATGQYTLDADKFTTAENIADVAISFGLGGYKGIAAATRKQVFEELSYELHRR